MLRYSMGWSDADGNSSAGAEGKAIRPTLCLLACEATGGQISKAIPAAASLELIHTFSLIHDDIQDRDATRHHRPTLWAVWGQPKALVAGNALRAIADMSLWPLAEAGMGDAEALAVTGLLTEAYLTMIEGQYLDISYEGRWDIGIKDYLGMVSRKTGALIQCPLRLGATIGTDDEVTIDAFRRFGSALGLVFQITDDVLGTWGKEKATGKPVGADIRRRKNTLPVVHAMSKARGGDKEHLLRVYREGRVSDEDVLRVLDVMDRVKSREYAEGLAEEHCEMALDSLRGVELAPQPHRDLEELARFLLVRER